MSWELALVAAAYLLGSIPSGLLVVWAKTGKDIRREGSGNVGATNATRIAGLAAGIPVTAMDVVKGALPMWAMSVLNPASEWLVATMLAAIVGHCFPVWLRFAGGKGVATAFGAFAVLFPVPALIGLGVWVAVLAVGRWVSLASLAGAAAFPLVVAILERPGWVMLLGVSVASALIIVRHHANIRQLIAGSEPRIGGRGR
ncbi:MAG TPA: glycerol-3-phosphate 1-O-acyltransferase PlsY [Thermoanaerobaculales bacterium]|nr:glycerol-3-phosphate 1-O-acyltransferase PlsY [Thermoanaerobaculales bacterium]HPA80383.1 glycerol-3-phosphate 1-O-acyltransferase PlsY [Thermoanaerobaculales bacterium]HQL31387.1 glycerol-3-phosphate 1-O-acyltransferase PlsY [Thermoanaerobaculales bacterium]HQN97483.1 glycerol-3-phosphate 1-O-acyltransferase PlsY [Thermoanaerobaculales bacterium]